MKIGTVLTASDLNPLYCDFIPIFVRAWKILFPEIDVFIILIAESIPEYLSGFSNYIRLYKPIDGLHTAFLAQCVRLIYPQLIERNEGVLISDIDMLPMNRFYYEHAIKNIPDDTFVSYRDVCLPAELPICYNIAIPSVWESIFDGETVEKWYQTSNYDGNHGGDGWNTDQIVLINKFNKYLGKKILLNDGITKFKRLDRAFLYQFKDLDILRTQIFSGEYSDYHCLRPYSGNRGINEFIINSLIQPSRKVLGRLEK